MNSLFSSFVDSAMRNFSSPITIAQLMDAESSAPEPPSDDGGIDVSTRLIPTADWQYLMDENARLRSSLMSRDHLYESGAQSPSSNPFNDVHFAQTPPRVVNDSRYLAAEDLYTPPQSATLQSLLRSVADSSRVIQRTLRLTNDKDATDDVKLKSLSTVHLIEFKARAKRSTARAIWSCITVTDVPV